jgi:hypothetical protein
MPDKQSAHELPQAAAPNDVSADVNDVGTVQAAGVAPGVTVCQGLTGCHGLTGREAGFVVRGAAPPVAEPSAWLWPGRIQPVLAHTLAATPPLTRRRHAVALASAHQKAGYVQHPIRPAITAYLIAVSAVAAVSGPFEASDAGRAAEAGFLTQVVLPSREATTRKRRNSSRVFKKNCAKAQ